MPVLEPTTQFPSVERGAFVDEMMPIGGWNGAEMQPASSSAPATGQMFVSFMNSSIADSGCLVPGAWCLVLGAWCLVRNLYRTRRTVPDP